MAEIRVFLLDDHDVVRLGLRTLLELEPDIEVVGEARTCADARAAIAALRPDVAILDANLPDGSGIDVCREARALDPAVHVMVLTSYDDDEVMAAAILAGAAGYVLKQIEGESLVAGVRLIASGHTLIDPVAATRVVRAVQLRKKAYDVLAALTPQQARILHLIAEGLSNREIADRLVLAEKTVKNHITGLMARLGVRHRTQAAILAARLPAPTVAPAVVPQPRSAPQPTNAQAPTS